MVGPVTGMGLYLIVVLTYISLTIEHHVEHLFKNVPLSQLCVFFGELFESSTHFLLDCLFFYIELHEMFVYCGN